MCDSLLYQTRAPYMNTNTVMQEYPCCTLCTKGDRELVHYLAPTWLLILSMSISVVVEAVSSDCVAACIVYYQVLNPTKKQGSFVCQCFEWSS